MDYETKPIKQVLMIQPTQIIPNISTNKKLKWIPWLGIFACPFAMKNWRKRKDENFARHASNRSKANIRNARKRHPGHEQWTPVKAEPIDPLSTTQPKSRPTPRTDYSQRRWQTWQGNDVRDTSHSDGRQYKRQRGDASSRASGSTTYHGPHDYGGSSSSSSYAYWDNDWSSWHEDQHWHNYSW